MWVSCIIAGVNKKSGESFLGTTDFHGTNIEADYLVTGLGLYYLQVIFENHHRPDMTY